MWIEYLRELDKNYNFRDPIANKQLAEAEENLGVKLPPGLRKILQETDGVTGEYSIELVWPLKQIVKTNRLFRNYRAFKKLYMPFDHLLFFGMTGGGDQFFFPIDADGRIRRLDVFVWDHEEDSRKWAASSLRMYFQWIHDGKIEC